MAEGREPESAVAREMFDIAATEAKRLETLTSEFLAFARTKEPMLRATPVRASLDYLAGLSKALAAEKDVSIDIVCDDSLEFTMDADQMHRAMLNLLTNALNATQRHGRVVIGAEKHDNCSTLYVEDTGHSIPDENVSRIFEPFFTSGPKGTGLGLPIVRKIAHSHGGEVLLTENEDGRVRFEIQF
jgi:signal transduction histidine kinase